MKKCKNVKIRSRNKNEVKILNDLEGYLSQSSRFDFINGFLTGMEDVSFFIYPFLTNKKKQELYNFYFKQAKKLRTELFIRERIQLEKQLKGGIKNEPI